MIYSHYVLYIHKKLQKLEVYITNIYSHTMKYEEVFFIK